MNTVLEFFGRLPVGALLALSASSVIAGDYFAKSWSMDQRPLFYALGLLGYLLSGIFYIPTLLREGLVVTSIVWSVASTIGFLVIGIGIFRESLTPLQTAGVVLGTLSLILLSFE